MTGGHQPPTNSNEADELMKRVEAIRAKKR